MSSVLITGASRGFGRELLGVFHERGWQLFPLVRKPEDASLLRAACGDSCHPILADISHADAEESIAAVLEQTGAALDVLINNAGYVKKLRGLENTVCEDIEGLFGVHCLGAFRCTRAALPYLRKSSKPVVINVSSRWASLARTVSGRGNRIYSYQIAKCAQNMLTACLDHDLKGEGIRVFAVHPGKLMTASAAADADTPPQIAAVKLADWIDTLDRTQPCGFHDLMNGGLIEW